MANPAPTINQINAFNATQGTIIDFNIIGGTELVRSNRIYIYDLSDNSLICTHLYVSTESIHELPANTDSSIIYESGKSSADFVNGAQYYAQIQTYTDTAGTEGGSGLSVAKMFWCLVDPTLTITTIPSTISTTSYNVSATYNANTSVVSNIIQQYQFNLYSATGSLLQSSGVVVGSGTQQGTSTIYDLSYNFTGLSVGSSYYVVVDVTTTQGMSISTQSNTFTVSIDTPTLGEATVVNNACDGYISVTSNLSGEYGGNASGEIASFVTSSVNDISSLKVTLDPIQDLHGYDKPWVGGAGKNKLPMRTEFTVNGVKFAPQDDGTYKIQGTATSASWTNSPKTYALQALGISVGETITFSTNIRIYGFFLDANDANTGVSFDTSGSTFRTVTVPNDAVSVVVYIYGIEILPQVGQTINAVGWYQLEKSPTATAFTPYTNICPISGWDEVEMHKAGKNIAFAVANAFVSPTEGHAVYQENATTRAVLFECKKGQAYTISGVSSNRFVWGIFESIPSSGDQTTEFENRGAAVLPQTITTPLDGVCAVYLSASIIDMSTVQVELGSTATDYHPYDGQTITTALPTTVYGGTLDVVSGVLKVDRAMVVIDGTQSFLSQGNLTNTKHYSYDAPNMSNSPSTYSADVISDKMPTLADNSDTVHINHRNVGIHVWIPSDKTPSEWFADNPTTVIYSLATPTTIQCDPQTVQTLMGDNNVWGDGEVSITYNIPITNLLVKRQDVADVSGTWLTLHSQPITQASDMDFTFIDFLNQYGKTYKYALVPLLTQTQSGVEVEVEGGYTVSDEVQSVFDGVFIADSTGLQKCKANVGYGDVDMNQSVGTITPIGAKYPVVITNSKNQYHNGSISGTIVPDDYYFNGNLSRIDMVNKRNELEQFLTNKRAKIIKDWNSNIWLVMIIDNINCSFDNNYGMGMVNFNASWIEVGDPTNQQDLQAAGLIDVGGV